MVWRDLLYHLNGPAVALPSVGVHFQRSSLCERRYVLTVMYASSKVKYLFVLVSGAERLWLGEGRGVWEHSDRACAGVFTGD